MHSVSKSTRTLDQLLEDLGWHTEVLPLEIMAMAVQSGWNPDCRQLQQLLFRLKTGSASTKEVLESAFAWLKDISSRHNKNKKMSFFAKHFYACSCPHSRKSCPQIWPEASDWMKHKVTAEAAQEFNSLQNITHVRLPQLDKAFGLQKTIHMQ